MSERPPEIFVHGFPAGAWLTRYNVALSGVLRSTEMHAVDPKLAPHFSSPRQAAIDDLRTRPSDFITIPSNRGIALLEAAIIRGGGNVGIGTPPDTTWMGPDAAERLVRLADYELALEDARRRLAPGAASRLSCIWLAPSTVESRNWVRAMMGQDSFLMEVRIVRALRLTRADARWLGMSLDPPTEGQLEGYWSGDEFAPGHALWEYLLDGVAELVNRDEDVALLRAFASTEQGRIGRPPPKGNS